MDSGRSRRHPEAIDRPGHRRLRHAAAVALTGTAQRRARWDRVRAWAPRLTVRRPATTDGDRLRGRVRSSTCGSRSCGLRRAATVALVRRATADRTARLATMRHAATVRRAAIALRVRHAVTARRAAIAPRVRHAATARRAVIVLQVRHAATAHLAIAHREAAAGTARRAVAAIRAVPLGAGDTRAVAAATQVEAATGVTRTTGRIKGPSLGLM